MIIFFDKLPSTNEYALSYGDEFNEWTIIWAKVQTRGRGRLGRTWFSPVGGLWFSILLNPGSALPMLPLGFSVGIGKVLIKKGLDVSLKWPNDFLVRNKKLGGILTEYDATREILVVGIGINCNVDVNEFPLEIRNQITTVRKEIGHDFGLQELIEEMVIELKPIYQDLCKGKISDLINGWREMSISIGRKIIVKLPDRTIRGQSIDIDDQGRLMVRTDFGIEKIIAGEVKFLE